MTDPARRDITNSVGGAVRGNVTQIGVVHGNVEVRYERRPPAGLPFRSGLPVLADNYQDRRAGAELAELVTAVHTVVLSGMSGVGKTQLAVALAEHMSSSGAVSVLWLTASSRTAVLAEYARLAADLTGVADADPDAGARRLLSWLASTPARWLVVLDDLRAPADLRQLWPPRTGSGRVLVTTRRRDSALRGTGRHVLHVDTFTPEESAAYLTTKLADVPGLLDGATGLAEDLGHLPLALAQAATYLADEEMTCARYRARFADRQRKLADLAPPADALPDDHATTVAAVLSLSIDHADGLAPVGLARRVLAVAALLDPNGFPTDVLTNTLVTEHLRVDAALVRDALRMMHRGNILTHAPTDAATDVRVHALVQRAARDRYTAREAADLPVLVGGALAAEWPLVERDPARANVFRVNTEALAAAAGPALWEPEPPPILLAAENSLAASGQLSTARARLADLHTTAVGLLGPEHPYVLAVRDAIANWQAMAGEVAGAAAAYESVLADRERLLGPAHVDTLLTRAALAQWRGAAGDPAGALAAVEGVLTHWVEADAAEHPMTLNLLVSRAGWLGQTEGPPRAIAEFDTLLADHRSTLGEDHPLVFALRGHRALWQSMAGDHTGAAAALERVLADQYPVLGALHPQTLALRGTLAHINGLLHGPARAAGELEALLVDQLRAFDPDHPHTVSLREAIEVMRAAAR